MFRFRSVKKWNEKIDEIVDCFGQSVLVVKFNFQSSPHNDTTLDISVDQYALVPQHVLSHRNVTRHEHVSCSTWSPHHRRRRPSGYPLSCLTFDSKPSCRTLSSSRFFSFILNYDYVLLGCVRNSRSLGWKGHPWARRKETQRPLQSVLPG